MDNVLSELNYDFNFNIYLFNNLVCNLSAHQQSLANAWVNKLKRISATIQEAQLRNDFLYYLVKNCLHNELRPPFCEQPPKGALINIQNLLPRQPCNTPSTKKQKQTRKCELFDKSPDKGVFLAAQPVPRCGAFCYVAVVSRPPPDV